MAEDGKGGWPNMLVNVIDDASLRGAKPYAYANSESRPPQGTSTLLDLYL